MIIRKSLALLVSLIACAAAHAKAPAAPSDFRVIPLGINSFMLKWKDNSKNEKGWEISISLGEKTRAERFALLSSPDLTSHVVITNELPGKTLTFQLAAYNGNPGLERFSKRTPPVVIKALAPKTFDAPVDLTVQPVNDHTVRLKWKDKSTSEHGYQIEAKKGLENWAPVMIVNPAKKFNVLVPGLENGTRYSFRVRAFRNNPVLFTKYSNAAKGAPYSFLAPTGITATPKGEGEIELKWTDKSAIESGYEVESKSGTAAFAKLWESGPNVNTLNITALALDTTYTYRVRAFRVVNGTRFYSSYSPVASAKTTVLRKPTELAGPVVGDASVKLTWKDNSGRESAYTAQYRKVGDSAFTNAPGWAAANATEFTVNGLLPNTEYEFRVAATNFIIPTYSDTIRKTTKHGLSGNFAPVIVVNKGFRYPIQFSTTAGLTSVNVTNLPAGLTFNAATRTITGTVTTAGTYSVTLTATYGDGSVSTRTLTLKTITGAPAATQGFASVSVNAAATKNVALAGKFADPDTQSAARVTTTKGVFDIILFPEATPATVNNFLDYVDDNRYDDSFFHRAPQDFVVQGGGFRHTSGGGFERIPTFDPVVNEPGITNLRGTVAMAKLPGDPHSATSQFFVNLKDNSSPLDSQNGGFTVFGRVATPGMTVIDAINALPESDYDLTIDGNTQTFEDVPVDAETAPETLDPAQLVKISSVLAAPILTYEITSGNTAIATAALNAEGTEVVITGVAAGSTTITVKATDLDGQSVSQNIPVQVAAP